MKQVGRYIVSKNPVWTVPLALPIVLFASQSPEWAVLFGVTVALVVPFVHVLSYFMESHLPRMLRIIPVLVIAGTVVTIVELFAIRAGVVPSDRMLLMLRAVSVSGIVIWPTIRAPRRERFVDRMQVVLGLTIGFVLGFALFSLIRFGIGQAGIGLANSVAMGFFLLAVGRMIAIVSGWTGDAAPRKEMQ
ncbi:MAG: hypothetical protein PF508_07685 [Spirochaeta sp.]|jgi:Na+-translocating ferredoxin:NAD+ oxidoreductase RnfE subunit|nr:hypothetical protein [Spirochaeta sp.]